MDQTAEAFWAAIAYFVIGLAIIISSLTSQLVGLSVIGTIAAAAIAFLIMEFMQYLRASGPDELAGVNALVAIFGTVGSIAACVFTSLPIGLASAGFSGFAYLALTMLICERSQPPQLFIRNLWHPILPMSLVCTVLIAVGLTWSGLPVRWAGAMLVWAFFAFWLTIYAFAIHASAPTLHPCPSHTER